MEKVISKNTLQIDFFCRLGSRERRLAKGVVEQEEKPNTRLLKVH